MKNLDKTISIIGIGRLGGALAVALAKNDYMVENLVARDEKIVKSIRHLISPTTKVLSPGDVAQISSDVILIATQDSEIEKVAENLAEKLAHPAFVLHTSGSLSSEVLKKLQNCKIGSLHPLVSVSDPIIGADKFGDVFFCIEGEPEAAAVATKLAQNLGGKPFSIETKYKTLYHASAVTACGHLVALIDIAEEMLAKCGLTTEKAQKILLPLIRSTIENLEIQNTSQALTGTFARLDTDTFERHVKSMRENVSDETLEVYLQLGMRSTHLVKEENSNAETLKEMRKRISLAKKKLK